MKWIELWDMLEVIGAVVGGFCSFLCLVYIVFLIKSYRK